MSQTKARETLQALVDLSYRVDTGDRHAVDVLRDKSSAAAKQIFGDDHNFVTQLREIKYNPVQINTGSNSNSELNKARTDGVHKLELVLREMLNEIVAMG